MKIQKVTAVRIVDRIEPCLPFWCDALGYTKKVEVPHGKHIGFVLLENEAGEVMLQTRESVAADLPAVAALKVDAILFVEVDSLKKALAATKKAEVIVPERTTFYGTREACVVDPQGTVLLFAEKA